MGEYVFWVLAAINAALIVDNYTRLKRLGKNLDEVDKLLDEARMHQKQNRSNER